MTKKLKDIQHGDYYGTSDFGLAAMLSLFYPIENFDRENPQRVKFLFKRCESLEKTVDEYLLGSLRVDPKDFYNQLKLLKTRLYSEL
jgi:hypothetical protein